MTELKNKRFLFIFAYVLFTVLAANANVTVDTTSSSGASNSPVGVNSLSWVHNVTFPLTNGALFVGVSTYSPTSFPGSPVSSVTYAGQPLQFVGARFSPCPRCYTQTAIYRLINPPAGIDVVRVTLLNGVSTHIVGGAISFSGVNQISPNGTFFSAAGTIGTLPALTVTDSVNGDLVLDVLAATPEAGYLFAGEGQTTRWNGRSFFSNSFDVGAASTEPAGSPVVMNWNMAVQSDWALGAVAVKALPSTAAEVSVGGRVMTATGRGIFNARVMLTAPDGETRIVPTGAFGYYHFDNVPVGAVYVLTVYSKRFHFSNPSQVVSVFDELTDIDFVAE